MTRPLGRSFVCVACVAGTACPVQHDVTPQVRVVPGAAGRWAKLRQGGDRGPVDLQLKPARVHVMKAGEELGGPNAIGRPGDLVLENDEVVFVVDQLGSSAGFAEGGGNVVDAADARARKDELGQIFTYFGTFPRQGVYQALSSGVSPDGSAWIEARGRELRASALAVTTRYTLHVPDRALFIETNLENTGDAAIELPSMGDAIQWGGAEKTAPGKSRGFRGSSSGPYIGGIGRFTSYAITSNDGAIEGTSGGFWTDTAQRRDVKLERGEKARYARVFIVGERPDTSSLIGELAMAAGEAVGDLRLGLPPASALPTGMVVTLFADGSQERLTLAAPFAAKLPVGRYWIAPMQGRTTSAPPLGPIGVRVGHEERVDVPIDPPALLELQCKQSDRDPSSKRSARIHVAPCKFTLQGLGTTADPDFGPGNVVGPARNQATAGDGVMRVQIAPGKYRVTASRGPEYSIASVDVDLAPSVEHSEELQIERVVDTRGYLACDFHQHTMFSADAPVATRDRIVANVAEGVEVAVASDHNVVTNLEPLVKEMGLDREMVAIPGDELTTDASAHPWGHANVFPLPFDASKPRGGAQTVRDRGAHELFGALRSQVSGELVVQVNHPRSGKSGYFDLLGFDQARGYGTDPGYDPSFDAVEVWNGRSVDSRGKVVDDWRALLRTAHVVTPTATTDTHGIVGQEAGYPRTYVRVADDGHLDEWSEARSADLVRGIKERRDVVLTNGPMLRVSAAGAPIGGLAIGRRVILKVHVECAPWVDVDTVRLLRASEAAAQSEDRKDVKLIPVRSGAHAADVTFATRVDADDALFVVASGSKPLSPVLSGDEREILPWAMTGAIWVDADGDGRALGRAQQDRRPSGGAQ
jgi:hypothetical protein